MAAFLSLTAASLASNDTEISFTSLEYAQDKSVVWVLVLTALIFAVYSLIAYFCVNLKNAVESDTVLLFFSATACAFLWLSHFDDSANSFLFALAVVAIYALIAVYCVHKNAPLLSRWNPSQRTAFIVCLGLGVLCGAVIGTITTLRYLTFSAPNFDFGLFVNMFHNMRESFLPNVSSERDVFMSHFAVHLSPIYYLILPIYAIFPFPATLQICQALALASGVIPIILLCRTAKLSPKMTMAVSLIYSLYPALSAGCFYDIHENCFLAPLLLWTFYFLEKEKYIPMYVFVAATLAVKEDAAVYIMILALFVILSKKKYLHGAVMLAAAVIYFIVALEILEAQAAYYAELYADATPNPSIAGPMINRFNNLMLDREAGLLGALKTALLNPGYLLTQMFTTSKDGFEKLVYAFQLFLPLGMIPFCTKRASRYLLIAPVLLNVLTNYQYQYNVGFQYHFGITAFLMYAMILNIPELKAPTRRTLVTVASAATCCFYLITVAPKLSSYTEKWDANRELYTEMKAALDTVPDDASVACSTYLLAYLADRTEIYEVKYHKGECDVDYVIYDRRYSVDEEQLQGYLDHGYTEIDSGCEKIMILVSPDAEK